MLILNIIYINIYIYNIDIYYLIYTHIYILYTLFFMIGIFMSLWDIDLPGWNL